METAERNKRIIERYLDSKKNGKPASVRALASEFGVSKSWVQKLLAPHRPVQNDLITQMELAEANGVDPKLGEEFIKPRASKQSKREEYPPQNEHATIIHEWSKTLVTPPSALHARQPYLLMDWQYEFLRGALADGIKEAGLSVARRNGKTGVVALLVSAYIWGPLRREAWKAVCVSLTVQNTAELKRQIVELAEANGASNQIYERTAPARIYSTKVKAEIAFLSTERGSGHSIGPTLALFDELGLCKEGDRSLYNALRTSLGTSDGKFIAISVRGTSPLFKELRERKHLETTYWQEHCAPLDALIMDRQAWKAANPGLGIVRSERDLEAMALAAEATPADANEFRALCLNQPVDPASNPLVTIQQWQKCEVKELPEREGSLVIGLDLGGSQSQTAACLYWPITGRLEFRLAFPDFPTLAARGEADGVGSLYEFLHERGELALYPGRITPVDLFLRDLSEELDGEYVLAVVSDRYRMAEAEQYYEQAGIGWERIYRGTGASAKADGSADVRLTQRAIINQDVKCAESTAIPAQLAKAVLRFDAGGNPALDKREARRDRIDAIQAMVLAIAEGHRRKSELEAIPETLDVLTY